jgi:hypothetical protein
LPYGVNCPDVVERIAHTLPLRIAYAGRVIQKQKRSLDIIPLVQELEKRNLDFRLSIIGDGPELDSLKKSLSIAAQNGKVLFVGRMSQDQMEEAWKDQDIFLNVSAFEGTSVSMLEAMAAGCAPIVTHVSGVDDVIEQGVNGFHAPVGDFQSLAGFVERLDRDRQLLAHVGNAAHRTIEERFSICDYAQKFAALTNCLMHQDLTRIPGHHYIKPETLPNGDVSVRGTGPLTVYTLFADECRDMMNEWFFGTMRDDWSVYGYCASGLDSDETNRHGSIAQSAPINRKVDLIIKSLSDCWGRVILWINPEVQFFGRCSKMIDEALLNHDIAFQSEGSSIPGHSPRMACCGIMAMRCNKAVLGFWTKVREMLAASPEAFPDGDQSAVNHLLAEQTVPIRAVLFDSRFWASSHGIMPPLEILAHHVHPAAPLLSRSPLDFTLQQFSGVRDYLNTLQLTPLTIAFEPLVLRARRKGIKKLACWPAGSGGREFLKLARQAGIEVTAFIDSNPTLQDTFIDDIRVLSPVQTLHAGSDTFAITSLIHSAPISRAIKKLFSGSGRVPRIFASMKSDRAFENQIRLINRKPKGIDGPCPEAYRRAKKCV